MRLRSTSASGSTASRLIGIAILAGTAAGCSSDVSRFVYQGSDGLTTASVRSPSSASLEPMSGIPNPPPGVPQSVSQAYPGDGRAPSYDPSYTGAVHGSAARAASSTSGILPGQGLQASVARSALPTVKPSGQSLTPLPAPVLADRPASTPQLAAAQPFPGDVAGARPNAATRIGTDQSTGVMTPDPIVTGTSPQRAGWTAEGGSSITAGQGETFASLSKRYGVPAKEIAKANGLPSSASLATGQELVLPVYVYSRQGQARSAAAAQAPALPASSVRGQAPVPQPAPTRDVAILPTAPTLRSPQGAEAARPSVTEAVASGNAAPAASGGYVIKPGDSLSKISRAHGVSVDALKAANGLTGTNLRIGQALRIPDPAAPLRPDATVTASVAPVSSGPKAYVAPDVATRPDSVGETAKSDTASIAPQSTGISKLRWPARGQVITGFAKNENGRRNDGIDISMPAGSPVKAAENGVVIYSGDGLKEYGNTVLIRHDDGLVTVYAHAQSLNVKRGDKVSRGQVIASSGMTGAAKTPRLHFEVRKNATPVDPTGYLE